MTPTQEMKMEWIGREEQFPDIDTILCYAEGQQFICELMETKWGNRYYSTDSGHISFQDMPEWTHWMPLPKPPNLCAPCEESTHNECDLFDRMNVVEGCVTDLCKRFDNVDPAKVQNYIAHINQAMSYCDETMKRLHNMMKELKGLIAMVRGNAAKNDWYGEELVANANKCPKVQIEEKEGRQQITTTQKDNDGNAIIFKEI